MRILYTTGGASLADTWNADHYDRKLGFVTEFGKDLISLLQPQPGETILDLGCGTGDLSHEIARTGASVIGMDLSPAMIQQAQNKYPHLHFALANGEDFHFDQTFDAVFSNAALHWMTRPHHVIRNVKNALRSSGRFVAEFGGKGNVQTVVNALEIALAELGIDSTDRNPWFFPSIAEYTTLLEAEGFHTTLALHFDRPTLMPDTDDQGLRHWLTGFAGSYFRGLAHSIREHVIQRVIELTRPQLLRHHQWTIDYQRVRFVAIRE